MKKITDATLAAMLLMSSIYLTDLPLAEPVPEPAYVTEAESAADAALDTEVPYESAR